MIEKLSREANSKAGLNHGVHADAEASVAAPGQDIGIHVTGQRKAQGPYRTVPVRLSATVPCRAVRVSRFAVGRIVVFLRIELVPAYRSAAAGSEIPVPLRVRGHPMLVSPLQPLT